MNELAQSRRLAEQLHIMIIRLSEFAVDLRTEAAAEAAQRQERDPYDRPPREHR